MKTFKHDLGDDVELKLSGETGEVIGRSQHANGEDQYQVMYLDGIGRQKTDWFGESQLKDKPTLQVAA